MAGLCNFFVPLDFFSIGGQASILFMAISNAIKEKQLTRPMRERYGP